jgi:predicted secreted Zn-dependent protease
MRHPTAAFAVVAGLSLACASAPRNAALDKYPADVLGRTTVEYYDVHGRTAAELHADMRRLGPKIADSSFVGETRSPMRWTWKTESGGGAFCSIKDVKITVTSAILLPRWTPPADAEAGLPAEWERFVAALETHEAGHKEIAAKTAHDIAQQLKGLSTSCSLINTRASDLGRETLDRGNAQQKAYDYETRHGATQGTSFGGSRLAMGVPDRFMLAVPPRNGTALAFMSATLDSAWRALPAAYAAAGLSINATDADKHIAGDSLTVRGTIAGTSLGKIVDCSPRDADSVAVTMLITSRLTTNSDVGTTMTNTIQAYTRPAGAPAVACRSRGVLERRLLDEMRRQVQ